jgi:hypothetical protein
LYETGTIPPGKIALSDSALFAALAPAVKLKATTREVRALRAAADAICRNTTPPVGGTDNANLTSKKVTNSLGWLPIALSGRAKTSGLKPQG